ncbi:SCO3933 family regulatory protein [Streptomyces sp. L500]
MRTIPVDTTRLGLLRCVVAPEPKLSGLEKKEVRKDQDGNTIYTVGVMVRQEARRVSVIEIAVAGEPVGVLEGVEVKVTGLEAISWAMGDRSGISFRAAAITPAPAPASPPASGKGGGA